MGETPGSVVTLLCSGMHFFNAEKRIADCVLEDTAGVAAMTSAELARCSSTSEATVTRFCKKLGFENYRAFQLALARDVMERLAAGDLQRSAAGQYPAVAAEYPFQ